MLTRKEIDDREERELAPYAMKIKDSRGRKYPEEEHPYRSIYQMDMDRIIHSTAFRRLEYKTRVFVNHEGDYYRTRLTHTIEVSNLHISTDMNKVGSKSLIMTNLLQFFRGTLKDSYPFFVFLVIDSFPDSRYYNQLPASPLSLFLSIHNACYR